VDRAWGQQVGEESVLFPTKDDRLVGLTRVASVAEAPFHLEFVSSFFINSESDHGEESGCGGANREARECKPNQQNRNPRVETVEARRRNFVRLELLGRALGPHNPCYCLPCRARPGKGKKKKKTRRAPPSSSLSGSKPPAGVSNHVNLTPPPPPPVQGTMSHGARGWCSRIW
jgi:hypothetical protein